MTVVVALEQFYASPRNKELTIEFCLDISITSLGAVPSQRARNSLGA